MVQAKSMKSKSASLQIRRLFEGMRFLLLKIKLSLTVKKRGKPFPCSYKKLQGQILQLFNGFIVLAV